MLELADLGGRPAVGGAVAGSRVVPIAARWRRWCRSARAGGGEGLRQPRGEHRPHRRRAGIRLAGRSLLVPLHLVRRVGAAVAALAPAGNGRFIDVPRRIRPCRRGRARPRAGLSRLLGARMRRAGCSPRGRPTRAGSVAVHASSRACASSSRPASSRRRAPRPRADGIPLRRRLAARPHALGLLPLSLGCPDPRSRM